MGRAKTGDVQIMYKIDPQNGNNTEALIKNKKLKTSKIKELLKDIPKKFSEKENLICKSYQLYNIIPEELRMENLKRQKKILKKQYINIFEKDTEKYEENKT